MQQVLMLGGPINEGKPSFFSCQQLHEKNCGLHALNHIAQHECFSRKYLNAIEKEQFGPNFTDELFKYGLQPIDTTSSFRRAWLHMHASPKIR